MTLQSRQPRLTAEAFIAWAMDPPQGRFELADGEVIAMSPERAGHARVKFAVARAFDAAISAEGLTCEAMLDGMAVRIGNHTVYEPDALVRCGPRLSNEAVQVSDPIIVVEAVSPSSRNIDTGVRLTGYFRLPSVSHYLIVNLEARAITHHRRSKDGGIVTSIVRDGVLELDPPGLPLPVEAVFSNL